MQTKTCSKCGVEKPVTEFHKQQRGLHGVRADCKACHCALVRGIAAEKYSADPDAILEKNRAWRQANPEKQREIERRKRATQLAKNPERFRALANERSKRYSDRNPGYRLKGNAERLRRWRERHPERELETKAGRRVAYKGTPPWGNRDMIRLVYKKARALGMEVDHVVPIKHPLVCGLHVWHNLQLLVRNENRRKKNLIWPDMP